MCTVYYSTVYDVVLTIFYKRLKLPESRPAVSLRGSRGLTLYSYTLTQESGSHVCESRVTLRHARTQT